MEHISHLMPHLEFIQKYKQGLKTSQDDFM